MCLNCGELLRVMASKADISVIPGRMLQSIRTLQTLIQRRGRLPHTMEPS